MPGRRYTAGTGYRYGFNGKENDNDVKGEGNQQDYGMRIYDTRLGKFLSEDPITKNYPELTPYQFASNNPIQNIDIDGLEGMAGFLCHPGKWHVAGDANDDGIVSPVERKLWGKGMLINAKVAIYGTITAFQPQVGFPLIASDLSGAPVTPSPQAMSGSVVNQTVSQTRVALEESSAEAGSVTTGIKPSTLSAETEAGVIQTTTKQAKGLNPPTSTKEIIIVPKGSTELSKFKANLPNVFKGIDKRHLSAAIGDMKGNPIVKYGKIWDHLEDISSHMRGLNGRIKELNKMIDNNTFSGSVLEDAKALRSNLQSQYDSYYGALQRAANETFTKISVKKKK